MFREKEIEKACEMLKTNNILLVYGPSGVGKQDFQLSYAKNLKKNKDIKQYVLRVMV